MRHLNWLVKIIFYKHTEHKATKENTNDPINGVFYDVGFIDQLHANLCTNASENMLYHFAGKPIASMVKNPRTVMQGTGPSYSNFTPYIIPIENLKSTLCEKGPFILALPLKYGVYHSVVVTGFANDSIIYNDPLTGSNKMLSLKELRNINSQKEIEIAIPNFLSDINKRRSTTFNENPKNIEIKKYANFFTIDKMTGEKAQCEAIKNFLLDYAKNSFWTRRHHKKEVLTFLDKNKETTSLKQLLTDLDNSSLATQADKTKDELQKRLQTIREIFNDSREPPLEEQSSENMSLRW